MGLFITDDTPDNEKIQGKRFIEQSFTNGASIHCIEHMHSTSIKFLFIEVIQITVKAFDQQKIYFCISM